MKILIININKYKTCYHWYEGYTKETQILSFNFVTIKSWLFNLNFLKLRLYNAYYTILIIQPWLNNICCTILIIQPWLYNRDSTTLIKFIIKSWIFNLHHTDSRIMTMTSEVTSNYYETFNVKFDNKILVIK